MDYTQILFAPTAEIHVYGLVFLLGSLTVAGLSDLRRMAAQTDFAEVWAAFTALMFLTDTYLGLSAQLPLTVFGVKWALIAVYAAAASTLHLFDISTMDVSAVTALLSLQNPASILLAVFLLFIVNELLQPILRRYGEAGAYPYLPTVWTANLLILLLTLTGGINTLLGITAETL